MDANRFFVEDFCCFVEWLCVPMSLRMRLLFYSFGGVCLDDF